ncbi:hypothetical protein EVAR_68949_1 [Eumeta japonica]|uniref:Uncharacterized protein n=1 Tax=Eumeta variegata TaxID=151549 RepID=A0A4C2A2W5_EUMVA|nr:hypothetical protein EVAR_68949_1 [Eumeta japonica]
MRKKVMLYNIRALSKIPQRRENGLAIDSLVLKYIFFVAFPSSKRAWGRPESRWSLALMDTRNPREDTAALPASWLGIGYLMRKGTG